MEPGRKQRFWKKPKTKKKKKKTKQFATSRQKKHFVFAEFAVTEEVVCSLRRCLIHPAHGGISVRVICSRPAGLSNRSLGICRASSKKMKNSMQKTPFRYEVSTIFQRVVLDPCFWSKHNPALPAAQRYDDAPTEPINVALLPLLAPVDYNWEPRPAPRPHTRVRSQLDTTRNALLRRTQLEHDIPGWCCCCCFVLLLQLVGLAG